LVVTRKAARYWLEPSPAINPDRVTPVDEHVSDLRVIEVALQRASTIYLVPCRGGQFMDRCFSVGEVFGTDEVSQSLTR
jgi:hypothetical protein